MNISFTVAVNGKLLAPALAVEVCVPAGEAVHEVAPAEAADQATPVIPLGSSVLAPGFEAALEF